MADCGKGRRRQPYSAHVTFNHKTVTGKRTSSLGSNRRRRVVIRRISPSWLCWRCSRNPTTCCVKARSSITIAFSANSSNDVCSLSQWKFVCRCKGRHRKNQFRSMGHLEQLVVLLTYHRLSVRRHPSAERSWKLFARAQYDVVVYRRRTADFSKTSAAAEGAASINSSILNLVSVFKARTTLYKRRVWSTSKTRLRMNSAPAWRFVEWTLSNRCCWERLDQQWPSPLTFESKAV